jgi:hypothetical protein
MSWQMKDSRYSGVAMPSSAPAALSYDTSFFSKSAATLGYRCDGQRFLGTDVTLFFMRPFGRTSRVPSRRLLIDDSCKCIPRCATEPLSNRANHGRSYAKATLNVVIVPKHQDFASKTDFAETRDSTSIRVAKNWCLRSW